MKRLLVALLLVLAIAPALASAAVTESSVMFWLDFADGSGATVTDETIFGFNMNVTRSGSGSPVWTTDAPTGLTYSLDYVTADSDMSAWDASLTPNINTASDTGTLLFWIKPDDLSNSPQIVTMPTVGDASYYWIVRIMSTGAIRTQDTCGDGSSAQTESDTTPVSTGSWQHIAIVGDGTTTPKIYYNGAEQATTGASNGVFCGWGGTGLDQLQLGALHRTTTANPYDGHIAQVIFTNQTLSTADIQSIYDSGTGIDYTSFFAGGGSANATAVAEDRYTSASLNNFSVIFNGSTYSTTNGTVVLPVLTNTTSLWSLTYNSTESGGYFERSYTDINLSTTHTGSLHQAEITFNASNRVSGAVVDTFTANTSSNGGTATDTDVNPQLNISAGSGYTFQFSKNGYYNAFLSSINISALEQSSQSFSVYDHVLNLSITTGGSTTTINFTADVYSQDYSFWEQASTTNGYIEFNLTQGNYTVWINDSIHALDSANITLNNTVNITNLVIDVRTANTFNITFYNETSNQPLDNTTVTWEIISSDETRNGTTTNGSVYEELLTPGSYEIRYWLVEDVPRTYYTTLNNQSAQDIRLYIVDEEISSWYIAIVESPTTAKCSNQTVSLLRYYIDINGYRTVDMARSDTNGQAVLRVIPNYQPYKLAFQGTCGDFVSTPSQLIDVSNTYTVSDAQSVLTSTYLDADTSLAYNNATRTFTYTWIDTTGVVTGGCLQITRLAGGSRSIESDTCDSGASGSKLYTVNLTNANNSIYIATGYLETNTEYSEPITNTLEISFFDQTTLRNVAPVIAMLILSVLMLAFSWSAVTLLVMALAGLGIVAWMGFTAASWMTITSFAILILIVIYRIRR